MGLGEPGEPGFATKLQSFVEGTQDVSLRWDTEVTKAGVSILAGGRDPDLRRQTARSQTVSMVKQVLAWRGAREGGCRGAVERAAVAKRAACYRPQRGSAPGTYAMPSRGSASFWRKWGTRAGRRSSPTARLELLDALEGVEGVYGGVVPGAGGLDAVALLMNDDEETKARVEKFLESWTKAKGGRVTLLRVRGEMEGVRKESLDVYKGWIS